jgi:hypothetical protein
MITAMITAKGRLGNHDIEAECINPGDWFGKVWLLEIGCGYSSGFFAVEADSVTDAIDEFSGSKYGHLILIDEADFADYVEDGEFNGYTNDGGQPCDLDNVMVHGEERPGRGEYTPWNCRYFADDLPAEGMTPIAYYRRNDEE